MLDGTRAGARMTATATDPARPSTSWEDAGTRRRTLVLLFLGALAIRLLFIALSDNEDGDAFARIIWSRRLVDLKRWDPTGEWMPGHFWLISIPYALGLTHQVWPQILTAIAGAATAPVVYLITERCFGSAGALASAVILACCPLHVRFSGITVAEAFVTFFGAVGLLAFLAYRGTGNVGVLVGGVFATSLASAHRLEPWLLIPSFVIATVAGGRILGDSAAPGATRRGLVFAAAASIFPIVWCVYSWYQYGDPLYVATWAARWNRAFDLEHPTPPLYVLAFWPSVLLASLGPVGLWVAGQGVVRSAVLGPQRLPALLSIGLVLIFCFQNMRHATLPQARHGVLLVTLVVICAGAAFAPAVARRWRRAIIASSASWLVVVWMVAELPLGVASDKLKSITPMPRHETAVRVVDGWLRRQSAVGQIVLGGLPAYGSWLSRLDDWYPQDQAKTVKSTSELWDVINHSPCGHVVVSRPSELAEALDRPDTSVVIRPEKVEGGEPFAVYRWGTERVECARSSRAPTATTMLGRAIDPRADGRHESRCS